MPVSPEELAGRYPRLYHMAHRDSWPLISRLGLLSTSRLLDVFEVTGERRVEIESRHRAESITIEHPTHGRAVIRDQKPMSDQGLGRALPRDISPVDWYHVLNDKVFFWLSEGRFERLRRAKAYRSDSQLKITVSTEKLLERELDDVWLSPINSGCTKPYPHPRDRRTFLPLQRYPFEEWVAKRGAREAVVELAVTGGVRQILEVTQRVELIAPDGSAELLWA